MMACNELTSPPHQFFTVCLLLFLPASLSLSFSLWGLNILSALQSLCIKWSFCHTLLLVCDRTQHTIFLSPHSIILHTFTPSLASSSFSICESRLPCHLRCSFLLPSLPHSCCSASTCQLTLTLQSFVWLSSLSCAILFSVAALWTFIARLLLSRNGTLLATNFSTAAQSTPALLAVYFMPIREKHFCKKKVIHFNCSPNHCASVTVGFKKV